MQIIKTTTKTTKVKSNNRSADITAPNFIFGCNGSCVYCYCKRYQSDKVYVYTNLDELIQPIFDWVDQQPWPKIPNQVGEKYYYADISNAVDLPLQFKYQDWQYIVDKITDHPKLAITFATTYPTTNTDWISLAYGKAPDKCRVRFSLMPQVYSNTLEPNTPPISHRINFLKTLLESGTWQVHYSFAPIVATTGWSYVYDEFLANCINDKRLKSECIFMTLSEDQLRKLTLEGLIKPEHFELKQSTHGGKVYRYNWKLKEKLIKTFKSLHNKHLPDVDIRYIF